MTNTIRRKLMIPTIAVLLTLLAVEVSGLERKK